MTFASGRRGLALTVTTGVLAIAADARAFEWTPWMAHGVTGVARVDGDAVAASLGAGIEGSFHLADLTDRQRYGGAFDLRWGPWIATQTDLTDVLAECGLLLLFGQERHAQWGSYTVRAGMGVGFAPTEVPHVAITVTGCVHSFLHRGRPLGQVRDEGYGSVLRLFATARRSVGADRTMGWTFGLEVTPSFFLPPYDLPKWGGAPVR